MEPRQCLSSGDCLAMADGPVHYCIHQGQRAVFQSVQTGNKLAGGIPTVRGRRGSWPDSRGVRRGCAASRRWLPRPGVERSGIASDSRRGHCRRQADEQGRGKGGCCVRLTRAGSGGLGPAQHDLRRVEVRHSAQTEGDEIGEFRQAHHQHRLQYLLVVVSVRMQCIDVAAGSISSVAGLIWPRN